MLRGGAWAVAARILKQDDDNAVVGTAPAASPTRAPTAVAVAGSSSTNSGSGKEAWYNSDAFIVSAVLIGVFLIVGAALKFWWMTTANRAKAGGDGASVFGGGGGGGSDKLGGGSNSSSSSYDYSAESASLLGRGGSASLAAAPPGSAAAAAAKKTTAVASFSIATEVPKFANDDLQDSEEATLMKKFTAIMGAGVVISLHTTKGPKPVLLSLVGDEVRWQAVKTAQKRYKLNLRDVTYVTAGKTTSNFSRARMADERYCFSLLTNKTTLDLEASSQLERDCLWRGFKVSVEKAKSVSA